MEEKFGIKGKIEYELRDVDGNLKDSGVVDNTITALMDAHVADQMSDSTDAQIGYIALGTGTGETSASTDLATYSAGTFLGLSGTAQGSAAAAHHRRHFPAVQRRWNPGQHADAGPAGGLRRRTQPRPAL